MASLTPQPGGRLDRTGEAPQQQQQGTQSRRATTPLATTSKRRAREGIDTTQFNTTDRLSGSLGLPKTATLGATSGAPTRPMLPSDIPHACIHTCRLALLSEEEAEAVAAEGVCCRGGSRGCSPHQDALEWHCTKPLPNGALPRVVMMGWR